jgi:spermidine synthase
MPNKSHTLEASEEGGVRFLHFGSEWVQGAMRIARPWSLELEYTREMMACLLLRGETGEGNWPRRVLQVGLGAASLTKFWYRHFPDTKQTIVEINSDVVGLAYQSFKLPHDPLRIDIQIGDGVAWMRDTVIPGSQRFDCIMVDGYDHNARFGALGTESFYRDCRKQLGKRGVLVLNLFGRAHGYRAQIENLKAAFDGRVLALPALEGADGGNAIAFAVVGEEVNLDEASLRKDAAKLQAATGLKLGPTLTRMARAIASTGALAPRPGKRSLRNRR